MTSRALALFATAGLAASLVSGTAHAAPSFTIITLLRDGDSIVTPPPDNAPIGLVTFFSTISIAADGTYGTVIDTDGPVATDYVLYVDGVSRYIEGSIDPAFPTLTLGQPGATGSGITSAGDSSTNVSLTGAGVNGFNDSALLVNGHIIVREGDPVVTAAFPVGTKAYQGFFSTKMDDAAAVYVMTSNANPGTFTDLKRAFTKFTPGPSPSTYTQTTISRVDDPIAGTSGSLITDILTAHENWSVSANGHTIYAVNYAPSFVQNGITGNRALFVDGALLIKAGDPSYIPGRNWRVLDSGGVDINSNSDLVIRATLDGDTATDTVIAKRVGGVYSTVAQEGGSNPAMPGMFIIGFGPEVSIDAAGNVLYLANFRNNGATTGTSGVGLFYNDQLIVKQNDVVNGDLITTIRAITMGYEMSEDGASALVRILANGTSNTDILLRIGIASANMRCQPADIADDAGNPLPSAGTNNGVNEGDYNAFFNNFFTNQAVGSPADIAYDNGTPLPPFGPISVNLVNNGVNEGDYNAFFNNFFNGCQR
ncbi:hypothetical protein BH11PLA1_BH11PLA1_21150 [soil metagenome]